MARIEDFAIAWSRAGFKTRSALARAAGEEPSHFCHWDNGDSKPSRESVARIAKAIDWTPAAVDSAFANARQRRADGERFGHRYFADVILEARIAEQKAGSKPSVKPSEHAMREIHGRAFAQKVREGQALKIGRSYTFKQPRARGRGGEDDGDIRGVVIDEKPSFFEVKTASGYRITIPKVALALGEVRAK